MHSRNPSYITKNRLGIYIFQYRIPKHIRDFHPNLKKLIRKSLKTRNRQEALRLARKLAVMMEDKNYRKLGKFEENSERDNELFQMGAIDRRPPIV